MEDGPVPIEIKTESLVTIYSSILQSTTHSRVLNALRRLWADRVHPVAAQESGATAVHRVGPLPLNSPCVVRCLCRLCE